MQKKAVKAIFLDLDGVLVDSYEAWFIVVNETLEYYKLETLSKKHFAGSFGDPIEKDAKTIYNGQTISEIKKMYAFFFRKNWGKIRIFKETIPVLKKLKKQGLRLALISNSSREIIDINLSRLKLKKYFDFTASMDDVRRGKPAPDSLLLALKKLKVKRNEAIFVGDTHNDILAGKRAKITTIGYGIKGDFRISSLKEIFNYFDSNKKI